MKTKAKSATARISKNGKYLIVEQSGQSVILNANLVRYLFDVPYTRKGGTHVTSKQIYDMKENAQAAYERKAQKSAI